MSWRDSLQQASFRGVEFFIDSHNYGIGRRTVVHQYPFQDEAYVEDLGQDADNFTIIGYILQKPPLYNYHKDLNKLISALKESGPGILVHRYLGEKKVSLVGKATISQSQKEGGIARLKMNFVEAGKNQYPSIEIDPKSSMDFTALDSLNRALDSFGDAYDTTQSALNDITTGLAMMKSTLRTMKNIPASVLSGAITIVTEAANLVAETLQSPCDLANAIIGSIDSYGYAAGMLEDVIDRGVGGNCSGRITNPDDAEREADELTYDDGKALVEASANMSTFGAIYREEDVNPYYEGGLSKIVVSSPDTALKQANRQVTINLIRTMGLIQACRIAVRIDYNSQEDAMIVLQLVMGFINDFIDYLGDQAADTDLADQGVNFTNDEVYQAIVALKPTFKKSMNTIGASLAKTIDYVVGNDVLNTIKLAYERYEDLDRDDEIVDRNKTLIFHPGFIPNGKTIDILSE